CANFTPCRESFDTKQFVQSFGTVPLPQLHHRVRIVIRRLVDLGVTVCAEENEIVVRSTLGVGQFCLSPWTVVAGCKNVRHLGEMNRLASRRFHEQLMWESLVLTLACGVGKQLITRRRTWISFNERAIHVLAPGVCSI